eukprot:g9330.t1
MSAALSAAEGPAHGIKKDEPEPRLTPTSPLITSPEKKPRLEEAPESRVQNARPASPSTSSMASPEKKQRIDFAEIYADHDFLMAVNYQVQRRRLIYTGFPEEWYYQYDMSKKLHHQIKMKQRARKKQDLPFLVTIKYKKSSSAYACLRAGHIYYKDAVDAVLENGFRISHAQLDSRHNRYGVGVYFARDPRLAHHFAQMSKSGKQTEICQVILARVVVGRCALKAPLKDQRQLLRPEHREPPTGFHSCTSNSAPGREVVVFPGSPGTPAYPAYVITYRMPRDSTRSTSLGNPYREQLLRVDFEDRASSQAFHRYQHHWRATLPRELRAERAERADGSAVRKAGQVPQPLSRRNSCEERRPATQRLASKRRSPHDGAPAFPSPPDLPYSLEPPGCHGARARSGRRSRSRWRSRSPQLQRRRHRRPQRRCQ